MTQRRLKNITSSPLCLSVSPALPLVLGQAYDNKDVGPKSVF